jgi:hypothetical protein
MNVEKVRIWKIVTSSLKSLVETEETHGKRHAAQWIVRPTFEWVSQWRHAVERSVWEGWSGCVEKGDCHLLKEYTATCLEYKPN